MTGGQTHDLDGADVLLARLESEALLADKAYDAQERVRQKLQARGCTPVIPSKANRKEPFPYDHHLVHCSSSD